ADDTAVLEIRQTDLKRKLAGDSEFAARFYRALAVFLADRLRATTRQLGYGKGADLEQEGRLEDELDSAILDTVSDAGERFRRLLRALAT
ncbi:MAG: cyclic nucleotide-binding protein, partial [Nevskiales bacterium]